MSGDRDYELFQNFQTNDLNERSGSDVSISNDVGTRLSPGPVGVGVPSRISYGTGGEALRQRLRGERSMTRDDSLELEPSNKPSQINVECDGLLLAHEFGLITDAFC